MPDLDGSSNQLFREGEITWIDEPMNALGIFKKILSKIERSCRVKKIL